MITGSYYPEIAELLSAVLFARRLPAVFLSQEIVPRNFARFQLNFYLRQTALRSGPPETLWYTDVIPRHQMYWLFCLNWRKERWRKKSSSGSHVRMHLSLFPTMKDFTYLAMYRESALNLRTVEKAWEGDPRVTCV